MVSQKNFLKQGFVGNLFISVWVVCYFIVLYKLWLAADHDALLFSVYAGIETIVLPLFLWGCLRAQDSDNIFFMVSTLFLVVITIGIVFNKPGETFMAASGIGIIVGVGILGLVQGRVPAGSLNNPPLANRFTWIYKKDSPGAFWFYFVIDLAGGVFLLFCSLYLLFFGNSNYTLVENFDKFVFRSNAQVIFRIAENDDKRKNYTEAITDYTQTISINPRWALPYNERGNDYFRNNLALAIADYNKAIELNPKDGVFYSNRGNAYFKLGDFSRAIPDYSNSILLNPNDTRAYSKRAKAYFMLKKHDSAWADVHKAESLGYKFIPSFITDLQKASGRNQ